MVGQRLNLPAIASVARVVALAFYASGAGLILLQGVLRGFLVLLRDIFSALALPFVVLMEMAGWGNRTAALGSLSNVTSGLESFPLWLLLPLITACGALVVAGRSPTKHGRTVCYGLSLAAAGVATLGSGGLLAVFMVLCIGLTSTGLIANVRS